MNSHASATRIFSYACSFYRLISVGKLVLSSSKEGFGLNIVAAGIWLKPQNTGIQFEVSVGKKLREPSIQTYFHSGFSHSRLKTLQMNILLRPSTLNLIACLLLMSYCAVVEAQATIVSFKRAVGPIYLNISNSSEIANYSNVKSDTHCAYLCKEAAGCQIAAWIPRSGFCQLVILTGMPAASGYRMQLQIGAEPNASVWLPAEDLPAVQAANITVFKNSSTGRTGAIQNFTVPATACYLIRAFGARGGSHWTVYDDSPTTTFPAKYWLGGLGAYKAGRFQLTQETQLSIVVGQSGGNSTEMTPSYPTYPEDNAGTGGGGGSFVYRTSDNYLYLAAGGGGGGSNGYNGTEGQSGVNGTSSVGANPSQSFPGGTMGNPGTTNPPGSYHGGPGAGWNGKFSVARAGSEHGDRGGGLTDGWVGGVSGGMNTGAIGGFGGGGGGSEDNGASGGGGGYSGGGAGNYPKQAGGGGGSYCAGVACEGTNGGNIQSDQGLVTIELYGSSCS